MIYLVSCIGNPVLCVVYLVTDIYFFDYMISSFLFNSYYPEADSLGIIEPMILKKKK
jgi:hypothetical protein